jgi:hypothetical protein
MIGLKDWGSRLESHFSSLSAAKLSHGVPVFALEHGLSHEELSSLKTQLRLSLESHAPTEADELAWVVYAAEFGYAYAGEEYWPSFEAKTPRWQSKSRQWMRDTFRRFASKYNGAQPAGAWAEWFSIISWPITHGILPRDLQRQLARLLFDARLTFRPELMSTAPALGLHLQALAYSRSARFRQFAENNVLLGQIAAALLLQDNSEESWILPAALGRIISDIDRERAAREWLAEARAAAKLRFKGLQRLSAREPSGSTEERHSKKANVASNEKAPIPVVDTQFFLKALESGKWEVYIRVRGLREFASQRPEVRQFLARSQGQMGGVGGRRVGRGYFLTDAAPTARLRSWPDEKTMLVSFDSPPPDLQLVLTSVIRGRPGQSWLFKIDSSGEAKEITSRIAHPGGSYILLSGTPFDRPAPQFSKVEVDCQGVNGIRFDIPKIVEEPWPTLLERLRLTIVSTVGISPSGLPAARWSDEGAGEWLSTDEILLRVHADHQLAGLSVVLRGAENSQVFLPRFKGPQYLNIGRLEPGTYSVDVAATLDESDKPGIPLGGSLTLAVRDPRDSEVRALDNGILRLAIYPQPPLMEDIWECTCELLLTGPVAKVSGKVGLFSRTAVQPLVEKTFPNLPVPLDTESWNAAFAQFRRGPAQTWYDDAAFCRIEFSAGEIGKVQVQAEREFVPIRWMATHGGAEAKLINLTGSEAEVACYTCADPLTKTQAQPTDLGSLSYQCPRGGALFLASVGAFDAGLVLVPPQAFRSLDQLRISPHVREIAGDVENTQLLLTLTAKWYQARVSGSTLATAHKSKVITALTSELFSAICGPRWRGLEAKILATGSAELHLSEAKLLVATRREQAGVAASIGQIPPARLRESPALAVAELSKIVERFALPAGIAVENAKATQQPYRPLPPPRNEAYLIDVAQLAAFSLRLASNPLAALTFGGSRTGRLLRELINAPIVARAARFMYFQSGYWADSAWNW